MKLSEAIRDYGDYCRHELGHTTSTYYSYVSWQRNFSKWLEGQGLSDPNVKEIGAAQIRRFSYSLSARDLRPRTVRGALHSIRALFAFLREHGLIEANPALEVKLPKKDAATRLTVTDEDLLKLLEATERQRSTFRCVRDKAVLSVLVYCGLRRKELLDLKVSSVNLSDGSLLVQQGKGMKARTVYLCDEAAEALRDWLDLRKTFQTSHDALFVVEDRRRFGETTLSHMVEEVKAIAGMKDDPRIQPHSIRHAAATRLMRNGADLKSIQQWLGHTQLQTTAVYLHTDEQQVRKIAPLAGLKDSRESPGSSREPKERTPYQWRRTNR